MSVSSTDADADVVLCCAVLHCALLFVRRTEGQSTAQHSTAESRVTAGLLLWDDDAIDNNAHSHSHSHSYLFLP